MRTKMLAMRDAMSAPARAAASAAITGSLLSHPRYRSASCVAAYHSIGSEFDTATFITDALTSRKQLLLPRVDAARETLAFYRIRDAAADLVAGVRGIREPDPARCTAVDPAEADFVLVPGLAFTRACERLGYGGGYYDRIISQLPEHVLKLSAAFSVQMVSALPLSAHDCPVDVVLTETAAYCRTD